MCTKTNSLSALLDRHLLAPRVHGGEPGAIAAIYQDGRVLASAARGLANVQSDLEISECTPINIASVSKQVTGAVIALASREGFVGLDNDVREYVPELQMDGISLRTCLNHTSGLPDYLGVADMTGAHTLTVASLGWFTQWVSSLEDTEFPPGSKAAYSNTGFALAALAVERAMQTSFPELAESLVFRPLGMNDTFVMSHLADSIPNMAMSYGRDSEKFQIENMGIGEFTKERGVSGDGEIYTTINDFANWHAFLQDGRVLGKDIRALILERAVLQDGQVSSYGLGIEHERRGELSGFAHSGSMWHYAAYSVFDPSFNLGAVFFANRDDLDATESAWRALRLAVNSEGPTGTWFSPDFAIGLRVVSTGDGRLRVDDGDEEYLLQRTDSCRWEQDDDLSSVELIGEELHASLEFGLRQKFQKLDDAGPFPAYAYGELSTPDGQVLYKLEQRSGEVVFTHPSEGDQIVTPYGQRQSGSNTEWIGQLEEGYIIVNSEPRIGVTYGVATMQCQLSLVHAES